MKTECPELERKRTEMLRAQGEFRVQLRQNEDELLTLLSKVRGNILEDDTVLGALEGLKKKASEIDQAIQSAESDLELVHEASAHYRPFSLACSDVYFTLEKLTDVHYLYQFSLPFFMQILDGVLLKALEELEDEKDLSLRLTFLAENLFSLSYSRVSRALLNNDALGFAMRLSQIYLSLIPAADGLTHPLQPHELAYFLRGDAGLTVSSAAMSQVDTSGIDSLSLPPMQGAQLQKLCTLRAFTRLPAHLVANQADWKTFSGDTTELESKDDQSSEGQNSLVRGLPSGWIDHDTKTAKAFRELVLVKAVRPDLLPVAIRSFVSGVFGPVFLEADNDLNAIVNDEMEANVPMLLVSKPGFDVSGRVDALASAGNKIPGRTFFSYAMGSPESFKDATTAVKQALSRGDWVLIKNVHLTPTWLSSLETQLHQARNPRSECRIFLTMELHPGVPATLLRSAIKVIFEPPLGAKASISRLLQQMETKRVEKIPTSRSRLHFLLAWLHVVVLERLRYQPFGWSKGFEFSEADMQCAANAMDEWIDRIAQGRDNLDPNAIPWAALRALLKKVMYGGRVDNEFDQGALDSLVDSLFTPAAYNLKFPLAHSYAQDGSARALLTAPDTQSLADYKQWAQQMPDLRTPELLGLPASAELMMLAKQGADLCAEVLALQNEKDLEATIETKSSRSKVRAGQSVYMVELGRKLQSWIEELPDNASVSPVPAGPALDKLCTSPLFRCLQREFSISSSLLAKVRKDLLATIAVCNDSARADNTVRMIIKACKTDVVPQHWAAKCSMGIQLWIMDFSSRLKHLGYLKTHMLQQSTATGTLPANAFDNLAVWLGGLTSPESFVAATRQSVAEKMGWSLEQVRPRVTVYESSDVKIEDENCFLFSGLTLLGAEWQDGSLAVADTGQPRDLALTAFTWVTDIKEEQSKARIPVYLKQERTKFLFAIQLSRSTAVPQSVWAPRGTCVSVWNEHFQWTAPVTPTE
jgi:dynein heavy chain 1